MGFRVRDVLQLLQPHLAAPLAAQAFAQFVLQQSQSMADILPADSIALAVRLMAVLLVLQSQKMGHSELSLENLLLDLYRPTAAAAAALSAAALAAADEAILAAADVVAAVLVAAHAVHRPVFFLLYLTGFDAAAAAARAKPLPAVLPWAQS